MAQPTRTQRTAVAVVVLLLVTAGTLLAGAALGRAARTAPAVLAAVTDVREPGGPAELVSWVTGPHAPTPTDGRWNVHGTDLGHPMLHDGELYLVFGDTWGADGTEGSDWRSNTMARLVSPDPRDGFEIAAMVEAEDGQAAELLPSAKRDGVEKTVIPTFGISVDGRMVLHYMSVRRWLEPGRWEVGHAGLATSDDLGGAWTVHPEAVLDGDGGFAQVAMVRHGRHVLVYGIPAGRAGGVRLARAEADDLLAPGRWQHWDGATWSSDPQTAAQVVPGPVGELSVAWNEWLGRWVLLTLDESARGIVLRTAPEPTGPWSDATVVTTAAEFPELYAPYIVPGQATGDDLWFTMSMFGPYQVGLMRVSLTALGLVPDDGATPPEI